MKSLIGTSIPSPLWRRIAPSPLAGASSAWPPTMRGWEQTVNAIHVIEEVEEHEGERWYHVSVSGDQRLPTWDELHVVKLAFLGPHRVAVQVFPRESEYVNINPNVLHLWCNLDRDIVPDLRKRFGKFIGI